MVLSNLPGIGERLMKRLDDHFGGRHELLKTLESGDISRIAEVEGISVKRALTLAREYNGAKTSFLATPEAENCMHNLSVLCNDLPPMVRVHHVCRC